MTPHTSISSIDKGLYNPFPMDLSYDNANMPVTGACNINHNNQQNNLHPGCKVITLGKFSWQVVGYHFLFLCAHNVL